MEITNILSAAESRKIDNCSCSLEKCLLNYDPQAFDQTGFNINRNLQDLLRMLRAVRGEHCFKAVISFYGDDFDANQLRL